MKLNERVRPWLRAVDGSKLREAIETNRPSEILAALKYLEPAVTPLDLPTSCKICTADELLQKFYDYCDANRIHILWGEKK